MHYLNDEININASNKGTIGLFGINENRVPALKSNKNVISKSSKVQTNQTNRQVDFAITLGMGGFGVATIPSIRKPPFETGHGLLYPLNIVQKSSSLVDGP